MGYSYINENGRKVGGRAADNHWLSENGFKRIDDLIDYVAMETAKQIKKGLNDEQKALNRRSQIKKAG